MNDINIRLMILYHSKSIDPARISSPTAEEDKKLGASGGFFVRFMRFV